MTMQLTAWKRAVSNLNTPSTKDLSRINGSNSLPSRSARSTANSGWYSVTFASPYTSISKSQKHKKSLDRDFFLSVLGTSVTKRDAKAYMNKFVPLLEKKGATGFKERATLTRPATNKDAAKDTAINDAPIAKKDPIQGPKPEADVAIQLPLYVALVKFRAPQEVDDATLNGVGKTLGQLRKLGLISIVVVDCGTSGENEAAQRQTASIQANRIAMAIDKYDAPGARVIDSPITIDTPTEGDTSPFTSRGLFIGNPNDLMAALQEEVVPIISSFGYTSDACAVKPVDVNDAILALTRQLSGLQFIGQPVEDSKSIQTSRLAEVYRLIVLDPLGGIPARNRATGRHLFLNLEQELPEVRNELTSPTPTSPDGPSMDSLQHLENAELTKDVLSLLPPTSSAVITSPQEVANERGLQDNSVDWALVGTRRGQNPLIHSLLTDKPVQSSSLPSERFRPVTSPNGMAQIGSLTTLVKRGMPLTVFPDPRVTPWKPPMPGERGLNLTDPCIDLPRLVNLIEDSFGRKLDVDHYLKRIHGNLAGIIIAGEYEGGALLTWEKPPGLDGSEADDPKRLVPYLDKFAVLRKSQGAGGVADIVFNAMVRGCLPEGVCWRSRKDNPVNKWYFERSRGSLKFKDMNWTMFWTTPNLALDGQKFRDYESVCRGIEPSWADNKPVVD
ncbi:N-acetylglutamate synthase [Annulohypoxylon maeteangense]|uniref:N-acetylglutamate synthase n=1 Tax=Annulohypoxylon maeteangense TaxID=1927788 RepID=UPI002008EB69|nr:N-acetylglutamate synthase [Annulohypoxylon maeteangense]KAI0888709.1 N-acetylglutamate synthase [Annulohypoxylon maeteangense]